jgi:hypothetical protein
MFSQISQNIKGTVIDKQSELPLIGATITIVGSDPLIGTSTDLDGNYIIKDLPIGRYDLRVSSLGYEGITVPNIELTAGKEKIVDFNIEEAITKMDEVVVTAAVAKDKAQNELATISARTFSVEEVNRYSGGRSDVARLAANFAGVSTSNDARNDIVIRGNSPTGVLWRLEGIPIPNPNHFSTAGTTGGPVSALNPNMLKNSDFLTSAFPAEYGNAMAGVFDLGFRNGNKDKQEYMFQLGAVSGFEAMMEGPINKKNNSSYLVAARYSFVGIASELGLPIGTNATPNYSDIAFNVNLGNTKLGKFSIFGIGGQSDIEFLHDEIDENDLFAANDEDSKARSEFGVLGIKHSLILDASTYVRSILSISTSANEFSIDRYTDLDLPTESIRKIVDVDNTEVRTSLSSFINKKFNARLTMRAGLLLERFNYNLINQNREFTEDWIDIYRFDDGATLFQSYLQSQYKLTQKLKLNMGLHFQNLSLNNTNAIEPRLALNYDLNEKNTISLGYGIHSQSIPVPILLLQNLNMEGEMVQSNIDLEMSRSQHFVLGYDSKLGANWRAKIEAYYQIINNVPVESTPSSFSLLNLGDDFGFPEDKFNLVNEGSGTNYGIELTIERFFAKGYYGLLTASIYDSKYEGSDGVERNSAFNNGYVLNALFGKEFKIGKTGRKSFVVDTKITTAGGRYYTPVDLEASQTAGREIVNEANAYTERYDPYFRWDVKFGMKINSKRKQLTHHFYFDFQNVTDNENIFARRYNRLTNSVNNVNQLGFFPDFMYRIQF